VVEALDEGAVEGGKAWGGLRTACVLDVGTGRPMREAPRVCPRRARSAAAPWCPRASDNPVVNSG